ncbi:PREDICTED: CDP-diacylglycerol--glycerol-3-phosphate 3-phosphatidyltransferase, mitochondrial [Bison bison bison]|uniref:CDP-diacylglycerol--glycerol-3-phosphate 3-phosphatidyltransferase n=1 Tax=Bison bison bison TaxID=43346 RepID=A0A6P3IRX1_BISBB|nr:PREDICTED: CDP-diacylglycerol--glycerol-3-phosphate 3-phosphatidyltransferase, mitochondrial [Bison bison bison]
MAAAAAAAAGPVFWRRLLGLLPGRPGLAALLGRLSDRLGRNPDRRRRRSPWLLLAPLLSPAVPVVTSPPCCLCAEGVHRFQWIRNLVPEFGVSSSHVRVLSSPAEFFELMKGQIKVAKRRVVMASLYLGIGPLEQELVDCLESTLEKSLQAKFPSGLRVSILLDFTRGSRGRKNSRTMLLPLLQRFPEQVRVSLFHTPNLRGLLRLLIPERFNETIGLQHIKVYLFDNNVILSGANLSDSYFTNRQDRYVFLQDCPEIADFFTELVDAVGDVSLQLQGDDTVQMVEGMVHPYKGDRAAYCRAANKRVMDVINSARTRQQMLHAQTFHSDPLLTQEDAAAAGDRRPAPDTWIYPLIQMKPFEIQIDEIVTETLLTEAERGAKVYLTTGYFNLTQAYMDLVLGTRAEYQILLASPEVNGFFGAKGNADAQIIGVAVLESVPTLPPLTQPLLVMKESPALSGPLEVDRLDGEKQPSCGKRPCRSAGAHGQQCSLVAAEHTGRRAAVPAGPEHWAPCRPYWAFASHGSLGWADLAPGSPSPRPCSRDPAGQLLPQVSGRGREWALGESVLQGSPSPCPGTPRPCSRDSAGLLFPQVSAARRGCGGGRAHFLSARFLLPAGLWLYLAGSSLPCLTLIGSPNFGYRSVHRDLEAQIAIVTESRALQQQLHQEQEQLYRRAGVVSSATFEQPSRQVKLWVKMVTPLIKNFF